MAKKESLKTTWQEFGRNTRIALQLLLAAACVGLIFLLFPKVNRFKYDFEKGKPWQYEDLISPFSFALVKGEADLTLEREAVEAAHEKHYVLDDEIGPASITKMYDLINTRFIQMGGGNQQTINRTNIEEKGAKLLDSLYAIGITAFEEGEKEAITLITQGVANHTNTKNFLSKQQAVAFIQQYSFKSENEGKWLKPILSSILSPNILYDKELDEEILQNKLSKVATTKGLIQKGEKVVENGDIIDAETYQKLNSLQVAYQDKVMGAGQTQMLSLGYLLATGIALSVLLIYLFYFRKEVFFNFRHYLLILLLIVGFLALTSVVIKGNLFFLYAIPFCIVPIVLRAFFGRELAMYVHLVIILIAGLFVPKPFAFVFIQLVAGIIAIYGNKNVRYWSQFFKAIGFIFIAYVLTFAAMNLIAESDINSINPALFGAITINAFLTFLAYPLIPFFEKLFGLISEISLVEYTDLNKPTLKKLSLQAPGTFQHSLQVANLAEAATSAIGGNSLMVKVGGLYHDIGKLANPRYFIENQAPNSNPHHEIEYEESAEIIIAHVSDGVKMAKKENLPKPIIDFIKTHHGTSRVEYFYRLHTQETIPENVDENKFIYPGPKPFTKEQAILMMADSIEAASKSLKQPKQEDLENLVDSIVANQVSRGQLDNAPITFKEIRTCKRVFKQMLASINHIRVEYPEEQ